MRSRVELARHLLEHAYRTAADNLVGLSLEEALFVAPGRSTATMVAICMSRCSAAHRLETE